jgi:hypothetical protein
LENRQRPCCDEAYEKGDLMPRHELKHVNSVKIIMMKKIERFIKNIITVKGKESFFCDSHPRLCVNCLLTRYWLRGCLKYLYVIDIATTKGRYFWVRPNLINDKPIYVKFVDKGTYFIPMFSKIPLRRVS